MKNNVSSMLMGLRSIRGLMLWVPVLSFIIAVVFIVGMDHFTRTQFGFILNNFISLPLFFGIFIFFFFVFTRGVVSYFKEITYGIIKIAGGDLEYRVPLTRQDQLGIVAQNINHMAQQLQTQLERERMLEQSKMELITHVSHDLRTPLTSIIGYLDLLKSHASQDPSEQERFIDNAFHKTQQLKKLIDDLFEYTRLTGGDHNFIKQSVDINKLVEQLIIEFEPVAAEQGIIVVKSFCARPVCVESDTQKIVRAIDNLLINALKYSIKPSVMTVKATASNDIFRLTIENEGVPINPHEEAQLFDRFFKRESNDIRSSMPAGTGLGLTIAKQIVEMHGGEIGVVHDNGHYIFWIEIPISFG